MIDDTAPPWKDTPHAAKIESPPCGGGAPMSAFGGKADVNHCVGECPLIAISGHSATRVRSPNSSKIGCTENS